MRIAILSIGSEGDIRPYITLGKELQSEEHAGNGLPHEVHLVTHPSAKRRVEDAGLKFAVIGKDPVEDLNSSEAGRAVNDASAFKKMSAVKSWFGGLVDDWFQNGLEALKAIEPDFAVLGTFPMNLHSVLCSEVLKIPYCQIHLMPILPTVEHAPPVGFGTAQTTFQFMAKLKWKMSMAAGFNLLYSAPLSKCYSPHGVKISSASVSKRWANTPAVLGYSTALSPRPKDYDKENVRIVGPIMDGHSDEEVAAFLETTEGKEIADFLSGSGGGGDAKPTVFVGFGSMWDTLSNAERRTLLGGILETAEEMEKETRGFVVQCDESTWKEAGAPTKRANVRAMRGAPHSWLFPRVDVVVCHGGAGTVHKAVLHGCSCVVCPVKPDDSDQPFWGGCVERMGLGAMGPGALSITGEKLAKCLRRVLANPERKGTVDSASRLMKLQDGVREGAKAVLSYAAAVK